MADDLADASSEASDVSLLEEGNTDENPPEETTEVPEGESEEETPEETEEEVEEEEEEAPEEEEDDEDISRPSWKALVEKYPDAAKDKDLREMFHREKAYSEVFPTVQDARAAANKSNLLDFFDTSIAEGKPETLLENLQPQVLGRFARNFLPALNSVDRGAFVEATKPFLIKILGELRTSAVNNDDKNLRASVENISKKLFGSFDLPEHKNPDEDPEVRRAREEIQQEREQLSSDRERSFFGSADRSIKNQLTDTVMNGLDPDRRLTDWAKDSIVKQVLEETKQQMMEDPEFVRRMQNLRNLAKRAGYTTEYKPRFISAYLGRAKTIALQLRAKYKAAAIGRRTATSRNRIENTRPVEKRTPQNSNGRSNGKPSGRKSDMDIILED